MSRALEGVRVVESGADLAAAFAGQVLAQLGAEVIKIEPTDGDPSRRRGPFAGAPSLETSSLFLFANLGKKGVTLDAEAPTGAEIQTALLATADIVLWGGDGAAGRAAHSFDSKARQVWVLVSPYGAQGPHAGRPAHAINLFHAGGEGYLMPGGATFARYPDREPIAAPGEMAAFSAGWWVAGGALAGWLGRDARETALLIDVSEQEALLRLCSVELMEFADHHFRVDRPANTIRVGGLVPAADGWAELMPNEQAMWEALVDYMGSPPWAEEFKELKPRQAANADILERVAAWSRTRPKDELYHEGQRRGIPFGAVLSLGEVLESPQLKHRQFFARVEHPRAGALSYPTLPWRDEQRPPGPTHAPLLGQHNTEVLTELGYSREEIDVLFETGVI